ncbi:hypothetical protein B0T17DRAFT_553691 [Bombardia bombarda]|uniref:Cyclochlorotine biosynthesis protein O n=1 Tax=Bombardia bombarda TaxID=252184 RepID=A0AA40CAK0_9PEZI|nr:hypothetical protein B0T17DRAFT_553691 [Bombardia bombarda]
MQSSYERGFASDLVPVRSEIELTKSVYNGEVELKSDGSFFMDPASQQYVSKPSIEVDMAWTRLLDGLNIDIDQSEADLEGKTFKWPESGTYFTGLEVFHSLHCLNRLRQAMYPEYYNDLFSDPNDPPRERHIGHCINHLRQAIQCHADLTPMEWKQVGKKVILNTATQHTCRNFEKIQSWAIKRKTNFDKFKMIQNGSLTIVD